VEETKTRITHPSAALRFLLLAALGLIVAVTVTAPWITRLLFGPKYQGSIPVLRILIWVTVPMYWNFVLNSQLIAKSFDRAILWAAGTALAVNVGFNLLLIPKFGYMACAVVTLITELALLATNIHFVSKSGAAIWPEHLGRLALSTSLVAGFSLFWAQGPATTGWISAALLLLGILSLPVKRGDFSTPRDLVRSASTAPDTPIVG